MGTQVLDTNEFSYRVGRAANLHTTCYELAYLVSQEPDDKMKQLLRIVWAKARDEYKKALLVLASQAAKSSTVEAEKFVQDTLSQMGVPNG